MKNLLAILITAMMISGCTTYQQGHNFDMNCINNTKAGVTTKDEMITCLGVPMAVNEEANGDQILNWTYVWGNSVGQNQNKRLTIIFDKNNKLVRISHRSMTNSRYTNY